MDALPSQRIAKKVAVEARAHGGGVRTSVYCQISLPRSSTRDGVKLLSLTPFSLLLSYAVHALPLSESFSPISPDTLQAARILGITVGGELDGGTIGRSKAGVMGRVVNPGTLKIVVEKSELTLMDGDEPLVEDSERKDDGRDDWIVVLEFTTTFGGLRSPVFANTAFIPLPQCLRNSLSLTLPPPPSPDGSRPSPQRQAWDLAVRPSLRPSSSDDLDPNAITGVFTSTPVLAIRWAPSSFTNHDIRIPRSSLNVAWTIGDLGWGEATVRGAFPITYAGLKEKGYVDLNVAYCGGGMGVFEVLACEGEGVIAWEILRDPMRRREGLGGRSNGAREEGRKRMLTHESEDSEGMGSPGVLGALEWRRPSLLTQVATIRSPSFTSLFDTLPPVAPEIDTAVLRRMNEPSLLRMEAPFGGSREADQDMSFETTSTDREREPSQESSSEAGEDLEVIKIKTLRIHLNLFDILRPNNCPNAIVSLVVTASFPSITLRSLSTAFVPSQGQLCLALPTFSIPTATHEDTVVTVDAGPEAFVNLLQADPIMSGSLSRASPLPAVDGKARWTTERRHKDREGSASEIVHLEVSHPPSIRSTLFLDDEGHEDLPLIAPQSPSISIESMVPTILEPPSPPSPRVLTPVFLPTILPPLRARITPVPPSSAHASWRSFTQLTFSYPFEGSLTLRGEEGQMVKVMGVWNGEGKAGDLAHFLRDGSDEAGGICVDCHYGGIRELMYRVDERAGERGVSIGDVLPVFLLAVAALEVEVLDLNGWELSMEKHTFDTVTHGHSTTFSRFDIPPSSIPRLSVHLIPSPDPLPVSIPTIVESKDPEVIAEVVPSFGTSLEWLALLGPFIVVALAFVFLQLDTSDLLEHGRLRFLNDVPSVVLHHFGFPDSPPSSSPTTAHSTYVIPTVAFHATPTPQVVRALSTMGSKWDQMFYWPATMRLKGVLGWLRSVFGYD